MRSIAADDGWSNCTPVAASREVHSGSVDLLNRSCNPVLFALAEEGAAGQVQLAGGDGFVAASDAECFAKLMFFASGVTLYLCLPVAMSPFWVIAPLALVFAVSTRVQWQFYKKYF